MPGVDVIDDGCGRECTQSRVLHRTSGDDGNTKRVEKTFVNPDAGRPDVAAGDRTLRANKRDVLILQGRRPYAFGRAQTPDQVPPEPFRARLFEVHRRGIEFHGHEVRHFESWI